MTKEETLAVVRRYTDIIVKEFSPEKVILFGSWAWGTPGPDSDADILVVKQTNDTRETRRKIDSALFPRDISLDILVYEPARLEQRISLGDSFLKKVLREGTVLYAR